MVAPPGLPLIAPRSRFAPAPTRPVFEPQRKWFAEASYDAPVTQFLVPPVTTVPGVPEILEEPIPVPPQTVPGVELDGVDGWRPAKIPAQTPVTPGPDKYIPYSSGGINMPRFHTPPINSGGGSPAWDPSPVANGPGGGPGGGWALPQQQVPNIRLPVENMPILTPLPGALPRGRQAVPRIEIPTLPTQPLPVIDHNGSVTPRMPATLEDWPTPEIVPAESQTAVHVSAGLEPAQPASAEMPVPAAVLSWPNPLRLRR